MGGALAASAHLGEAARDGDLSWSFHRGMRALSAWMDGGLEEGDNNYASSSAETRPPPPPSLHRVIPAALNVSALECL